MEVIIDSRVVVRNNVEISHVYFAKFDPVIISLKIIIQHHNQDTDTDTFNILNIFITTRISQVVFLKGARLRKVRMSKNNSRF